jgi:hypothetical protein
MDTERRMPCLTRRLWDRAIPLGRRVARYGWAWAIFVVVVTSLMMWQLVGGLISAFGGLAVGIGIALAALYLDLLYLIPGLLGVVVLWGISTLTSVADVVVQGRRLLRRENRIAIVVLGVNGFFGALMAYAFLASS